jgi:hypothetical protein
MKIGYFRQVEGDPASEWRAAALSLGLLLSAGVAPAEVRLHVAPGVGAAFRAFARDHGLALTPAHDGRPDPAAFADCDRVVVCESADDAFPPVLAGRVLADPTLFALFEAWQAACAPVAPERAEAALSAFRNPRYLRHNARRLEHLAALRLDLRGKSVLEFGAGIGDHSQFFLDRGCHVVAIEPRPENVACMRARYDVERSAFPRARHRAILAEAERAQEILGEAKFQIVHNYGLLYHLDRPEAFLRRSAEFCEGLYLLETAVSDLAEGAAEFAEDRADFTHAVAGRARLLSRADIFAILRERLPYVYMPRSQPAHEQFLTDWTAPPDPRPHRHRAVFVASRTPLIDPGLADHLLMRHAG